MNTLARNITDFFNALIENKTFKSNSDLQRFLGIGKML